MPNIFETTDAPNNAGTTYTLSLGQTAQGNLIVGDGDYYRISVVQGHTYTIAMIGTGNPLQRVLDPYMNLIDFNGSSILLTSDDDGPGISAQIHFTAHSTGTFFLDAGSFHAESPGQYGVSFIEGTRANFDEQMGAGDLMRPYADADHPETNRFTSSWSTPGTPATITWGVRQDFANSTDAQGNPAPFSRLSGAETAAVQTVLAFYSEVARLTFTQVNPGGTTDNATMLYSNYDTTADGSGAYAVFPVGSPGDTSAGANDGDVRLNISQNNVSTTDLHRGSYSFQTILHETGHALGMPHPGDYNATPGQQLTYDNSAQFIQDSHQYTVMSYFDESNTGAHFADYPQTLMMFDILAMQELYGANFTTRSGNTVYGFGSNAGGVYDFSTNQAPALCIWDGGGTDTLNVSGFSQASIVNLGPGTFSSVGGYTSNVSIAIGAIIENATTGKAADTLIGNLVANVLNGGGGADNMAGLAGNDTYYVDNAGDKVIELAGGGADRVLASVTYALSAGQQIELFTTTNTAGTTALNLTGNEFAQTIGGNAGANVINGAGGADTMYGYGGNDTYYVDNAGDRVIEAASGGSDRVLASVNYTLTAGAEIELFTTTNTAGAGALNLTGNALAQSINGNNGANIINGAGGADTMYGYGGSDTYYVDNAGDRVFEAANGGSDRVMASVNYTLTAGQQIELFTTTLTAGTTAINLTGNAFSQTIGGNAGANIINGAGGADLMYGYGGNDIYYVDNALDHVTEAIGGGSDRVMTSVNYTVNAGAQIELFTTTNTAGIGAINLTGNEFTQTVQGNAGANVIDGKGGADTLYGFGGHDTFAFSTALAANNVDNIIDFSVVDDTIQLAHAIFTGLASGHTLDALAFHIGPAATTGDQHIIYNSTTGNLYFDDDGSGVHAQQQFAHLSAGLSMTNADFYVV